MNENREEKHDIWERTWCICSCKIIACNNRLNVIYPYITWQRLIEYVLGLNWLISTWELGCRLLPVGIIQNIIPYIYSPCKENSKKKPPCSGTHITSSNYLFITFRAKQSWENKPTISEPIRVDNQFWSSTRECRLLCCQHHSRRGVHQGAPLGEPQVDLYPYWAARWSPLQLHYQGKEWNGMEWHNFFFCSNMSVTVF